MSLLRAVVIVVVIASLTNGCYLQLPKPIEGSMTSTLTGTVTYRQRIALPPEAMINVRLEDVSRADAPAELIAETSVKAEKRQVPIPFSIRYDQTKIQPNHRYQARASIRVGDELRFASARAFPVLGGGEPRPVEIEVEPVSEQTADGDATFEETHWKLIELNGQPAVVADNFPAAHLIFRKTDNRIAGGGGVNRLMGTFQLDGNKLTIKPGGMTMMAGPEPLMKQEQAFGQMLAKVNGDRISGQTLELLDGETVLAKFQAVYLK